MTIDIKKNVMYLHQRSPIPTNYPFSLTDTGMNSAPNYPRRLLPFLKKKKKKKYLKSLNYLSTHIHELYFIHTKISEERMEWTSRLSRASPEQFVAMAHFMTTHGDIGKQGLGLQGRINAELLWQEMGDLLNSIKGGAIKSIDKWKRVWADWKAKTKKKALKIRRTPNHYKTLTVLEQRVLGIMNLTALVSKIKIEDRGFDESSPQSDSYVEVPPMMRDPLQLEYLSKDATDELVLALMPKDEEGRGKSASTAPSPQPLPPEVSCLPPQVTTQPSAPVPAPAPTSATPATAAAVAPEPARRWQRLHRARARRLLTPYERATREFVDIENRRLQFEEDREKKYHEREMIRLQQESRRIEIESRRIEIEDNRNQTLSRLTDAVNNLTEMLPRLR